ncbi:hypothetical protein Pint_08770 [Pistacia integerrima]|uniref:Uncharacterized protein n=1 Tax=Pistacia integerrima TaxID=434235 RepID=A0ACC0XWS5_9ROSI|nr:hypothetical protein Pint_08770 [Pistacia integerrima]
MRIPNLLEVLSFLLLLLLLLNGSLKLAEASQRKKKCPEPEQTDARVIGRIGGVIDLSSRVGKEQKIGMEMAVTDFHRSTACSEKLVLHLKDSHGNIRGAVSGGKVFLCSTL